MVWAVIPYERVGPLIFGMSLEAVRLAIGDGELLPKTKWRQKDVMAFDDSAYFCHFDGSGGLESVVLSEDGPRLEIPGRSDPLPFDYAALLAALSALGHEQRMDSDVGIFDDIGVSIYAPGGDLEAVAAFRRGYYDDDG